MKKSLVGVISAQVLARPIAEFTSMNSIHKVNEGAGVLVCSCSPLLPGVRQWCEHIEETIRQGWDAVPPGTLPKVAFEQMPESLVVPVVPTQGFWLDVILGPIENEFRSVTLSGGGQGLNRLTLDRSDRPVLGYITAGEGRIVIRTLIFEWLRSLVRTVPNCPSSLHGITPRWSKRDPRTGPISSWDWHSLWLLHTGQSCAGCLQSGGNIEDDAPILSSHHALSNPANLPPRPLGRLNVRHMHISYDDFLERYSQWLVPAIVRSTTSAPLAESSKNAPISR